MDHLNFWSTQKFKTLQMSIKWLFIYSLDTIKFLLSHKKNFLQDPLLKLCLAVAAILDFRSTLKLMFVKAPSKKHSNQDCHQMVQYNCLIFFPQRPTFVCYICPVIVAIINFLSTSKWQFVKDHLMTIFLCTV
jgi:hypothetical protein